MVQKMLPPPWPEAILSTTEEAEAFLEEHSRQYKGAAPLPPPHLQETREVPKQQQASQQLEQSEEMPSVPEEPRLMEVKVMEIWPKKGYGPREWHSPLAKAPIQKQPPLDSTPPGVKQRL